MIFSILNIGLCIVFAIYGIRKDKVILNPLTLFCSIWGIITLFSSMHLYGLYEADEIIYFYILVGCAFFVIGYLFIHNINFKIRNIRNKSYGYSINYRLIYILIVICTIYYLYQIYLLRGKIAVINLWSIQQYLRNDIETLVTNKYLRALNSFIIGPISFAIPSLTAADIWIGKRDKHLIALTAAMLIVKVISTANRSTLMIFFLLLIADAMIKLKFQQVDIYSKWKSSSGKLRRNIRLIFVAGVILFIAMTISRNLQIGKSLYLYFSIQPYMFQLWSEQAISQQLIGYGTASLSGFVFPIVYAIQLLFGLPSMPLHYQNIYDMINSTVNSWQIVGEDIPANAYVSIFWYFFVDGRIIGIIVGSLIFGIICGHFLKMIAKHFNVKTLCLYNTILIAVLYTYVRMQFSQANFALSLLFVWLFAFKRNHIAANSQNGADEKMINHIQRDEIQLDES